MLGVPIFNERTGQLVGGHQRVEQLRALGMTHVRAMVVDFDPTDQKAVNILLNNPAIAGEFTDEVGPILDELSGELGEEDFEAGGFADLEALLFDIVSEDDEQDVAGTTFDPDYIPPPPAKPKTKKGAKVTIGRHTLHCADCMAVMAKLPDNSVDAIVSDPPYGLSPDGKARTWDDIEEMREKARNAKGEAAKEMRGFMGNTWDAGVPGRKWAAECLRVLKPGGYLLAASSGRTYHVLAYAVDRSGFDMLEMVDWLYTSNMPKSMDIAKAIDKQRDDRAGILKVTAWIRKARDAAGVKNKQIDDAFGFAGMAGHWTSSKSQPSIPTLDQVPKLLEVLKVKAPPKAIQTLLVDLNGRKGEWGEDWKARDVTGQHKSARVSGRAGYGYESGTPTDRKDDAHSDLARLWAGWGTALKNCKEPFVFARKPLEGTYAQNIERWGVGGLNIDGCRLPDGDPMWWGDNDPLHSVTRGPSGQGSGVGSEVYGRRGAGTGTFLPNPGGRWPPNAIHVSKPGTAEREAGCEELPSKSPGQSTKRKEGSDGLKSPRAGAGRSSESKNHHPTVKPVALMEWLLRLVCPPGAHVLEPFAGSGTTLVAARGLDVHVTAAELDPAHCDIVRARVSHSEKESPFAGGKG